MSDKLAPVALFVYRRPAHTRATLEALANNHQAGATRLFVFCDGAAAAAAEEGVAQVRRLVREFRGFADVVVIERAENLGLAQSLITGVGAVAEEHGRVIVVEDDIVTSPAFLDYMNDGLNRYADDDRVISIHGYVYPLAPPVEKPFFLVGADCWGWATWKRGWQLFEPDAGRLLAELRRRGATSRFDFDGSYPFTRLLEQQAQGLRDSWAIRWNAAAFLAEKLTLYPARSLVHNIGNDGSGTNGEHSSSFDTVPDSSPVALHDLPVAESASGYAAFRRYFLRSRPSLTARAVHRLRQLFR